MELFNVANFGEVTSTNEQVKNALRAHANEGYVCRAHKQTGGYGRQGRYWTSPEGGLYQSALLRPDARERRDENGVGEDGEVVGHARAASDPAL